MDQRFKFHFMHNEKREPSRQDLHRLQQANGMAKKMGEGLGSSQILQRAM